MKNIIILGSTGSIGTQTIDVVRKYRDQINIIGLSCNSNVDLLIEQIKEFQPKYVAIPDEIKAKKIIDLKLNVEVFYGKDCINKLAAIPADLLLNSLVGISGLIPTTIAIKAKTNIALANKETLVTGGHIVKKLLEENNVDIYPVDSEHSAIWQCLNFDRNAPCQKLILTASGGAFRDLTIDEVRNAKAKDALKHPTWSMGAKVTIDSATMMNKGLEIIEAMHLFNKSADNIDVVCHKQSVVHSMIKYENGSIMAQMSYPDMKLPIELAVLYPNRGNYCFSPLDFTNLNLTFEDINITKYPCLKIAKDVAKTNGLEATIMNAANEILVDFYLKDIIKFYEIPYFINKAIDTYSNKEKLSLDTIVKYDQIVREYTKKLIEGK